MKIIYSNIPSQTWVWKQFFFFFLEVGLVCQEKTVECELSLQMHWWNGEDPVWEQEASWTWSEMVKNDMKMTAEQWPKMMAEWGGQMTAG